MAADKTSMANRALTMLGAGLIVSMEDEVNKKQATLCRENFDDAVEEVLAEHRWSFARARKVISPLEEPPAFGWDYQFQVPKDCVALRKVTDSADLKTEWTREGDRILANVKTIHITYTTNQVSPPLMPPKFREAVAAKLAAIMARPLTGSRQVLADMLTYAEAALEKAKDQDHIETPVTDAADETADTWLSVRD